MRDTRLAGSIQEAARALDIDLPGTAFLPLLAAWTTTSMPSTA